MLKTQALLLAALMCAGSVLGAAKLNVLSYSFKEKTMVDEKKPGINDDPGFRKLTDGKTNVDGSKITHGKVTWRHIDNARRPVVITFNFKDEVKLAEAKVHYYRWWNSYGFRSIKIVGIKANGAKIPMGTVTLNHTYKKPKEDPFNMVATIKSEDDTPVRGVEMTIYSRGVGGYLSLSEVEFFGEQLKGKAAALPGNPLDKFAANAKPGLRMFQSDGLFVLENDYSIYCISPKEAGAVSYAYNKSAKSNMILYSSYGPFFHDRFWPGGRDLRDMFLGVTYKAEVIKDTPELKQVRMTGTGKSGIYANVKIEKVYTLKKGSSILQADFTISNGQDNVVPLNKGYWGCGGVSVASGYFRVVPGMTGVERTGASVGQLATRDLSAGWYGAETDKYGMAMVVPWELLKEVYYWTGNGYSGTVESKLGVYPINAGSSLNFTSYMALYDNIGTPDKVTDFAAGSFGLAPEYPVVPKTLTFKARLFTPDTYDIRIYAGALVNNKIKFKQIAKGKVSGTHANFPFKAYRTRATVVYRAEILKNGKVMFQCDAATVCGGRNTGLYQQPLPGVKKPDASGGEAKLELNFNSKAVAGPHEKWAVPYAGTKPKVLAINLYSGGIRDMIETSMRCDMDLTTNYLSGLWSLSGHVMSLNLKSCANILTQQLKKDYDVIVVSAHTWDAIGKGNAAAILRKVANGTGLVMVAPRAYPAELNKYITLNKKIFAKEPAPWSGDLMGLDPKLFPSVKVLNYSKFGNVQAKAGNVPLLGSFKYGKGKVYALSYIVVKPNARSGLYGGPASLFLPMMAYSSGAVPEYDYHEYQIGLLGKVIYAASPKGTPVKSGKLALKGSNADLTIDAFKAEKATVTLTLRDKYSAVLKQVKQNVSLKAGVNNITVKIPATIRNGMHIVDTVVTNSKGTLWWGSAVMQNNTASKLTVKYADRVYKKSEKIAPSIKVTGKGKVKITMTDTFGNVFARAEGAKAAISLADCRTPIARMTVDLVDSKGRILDQVKCRIELYQAPDRKRMNITQGWPGLGSKGQLFALDTYLNQFRKFGITCFSGSNSSRDVPKVEKYVRNNGFTYLSSVVGVVGHGVGGKRPFNTKVKPKTKFDLIRTPCLSKPGFKENLGKVNPKSFGPTYKYGVIVIPGPDEANMFGSWDGCFSPHCQVEFRKWLKKVYPSLAALNKSWDTDFKKWDDVIALTSDEVRDKKSFAGWMDHRTFNDWNRADAFGVMINALSKATGGLPYSLSGTSDTNPWNAWDWYQLMPHLKSLASYSGEQTIQHRSFAPHRLSAMPWIGYDSSYDAANYLMLFNLINGATGFSIYGNMNFQPDYQISPGGQSLINAINRYRNGIGESIITMDYKSYPIAFHYTPASIKLNWMLNLSNQQSAATAGFRQLVNDAGLVYDYVAYGTLEKTGMPSKYKVMFLPLSSALSDKEAAALEKFVKDGGILIANFLTGTYDEHGKKRAVPALNKVFGIKSTGDWKKEKCTVRGEGILAGLNVAADCVETNLKATTAKVIGKADGKPVVFENKYGKGKAYYFGASAIVTFGDWKEMRYSKSNKSTTDALNKLAASVFKTQKISPFATAPTLTGTTLTVREANGAAIMAALRSLEQSSFLPKDPVKHKINLHAPYHVYDLINQKYIGYGKSFEYSFAPNTQSAFSMVPYRGKRIDVKFTADGAELTLVADAKKFANHVFHVELVDEKGVCNLAYNDVVIGKGNKAFYRFRKPMNGKTKWKLQVREILTAQKTTVAIP